MDYTNKIKDFCKKKNITVKQLERDLGYSNGYIITLKNKIPLNRMLEISKYLNVPYEAFIPDEYKQKGTPEVKSPLVYDIMEMATECSNDELEKIIEYAEFVLSKR